MKKDDRFFLFGNPFYLLLACLLSCGLQIKYDETNFGSYKVEASLRPPFSLKRTSRRHVPNANQAQKNRRHLFAYSFIQ